MNCFQFYIYRIYNSKNSRVSFYGHLLATVIHRSSSAIEHFVVDDINSIC